MISENREYSEAWNKVAPPDDEDGFDVSKFEPTKLAGLTSQTEKGLLDNGVHPDQEAIEQRVSRKAEKPPAPTGQVGKTSITQAQEDSLVKALRARDRNMTEQQARERANRMNSDRGIRVAQ